MYQGLKHKTFFNNSIIITLNRAMILLTNVKRKKGNLALIFFKIGVIISSDVQVYIKLNCEKSLNAITMISEIGNSDKMIVVGNYDNTKAEFKNKNEDFYKFKDFAFLWRNILGKINDLAYPRQLAQRPNSAYNKLTS